MPNVAPVGVKLASVICELRACATCIKLQWQRRKVYERKKGKEIRWVGRSFNDLQFARSSVGLIEFLDLLICKFVRNYMEKYYTLMSIRGEIFVLWHDLCFLSSTKTVYLRDVGGFLQCESWALQQEWWIEHLQRHESAFAISIPLRNETLVFGTNCATLNQRKRKIALI